jgi:Holliday junction resolvasome RuvABC endonuclease subunit
MKRTNLDKTAAGILGMARAVDEQRDRKPRILACDPSFTAWGWAVLEGHQIISTGCIRTQPEAKKRRIREGDDRARRTRDLIQELNKIIQYHNVTFIVAELPHGSQNAKAAIMMGIVVGILEGFNVLRNISLEWYSENDAKKALFGRISASKAEVIRSISELYDVPWKGIKYHDEAVADALAIYYAAECNSPTIKYMNR